ncbi:MAG: hypothetical protein GY850_23680 [bacterium]|nr:hypothetical protein [bacterium]
MTHPKSPFHRRQSDRRSHIDRRWIKSHYQGEERRSGKDRRKEIEYKGQDNKGLAIPENSESKELVGFEKLLVSYTIQLEAVTRLLLEKGILDKNELLATMKMVRTEYQHHNQS